MRWNSSAGNQTTPRILKATPTQEDQFRAQARALRDPYQIVAKEAAEKKRMPRLLRATSHIAA
jgi:hypothetical protein